LISPLLQKLILISHYFLTELLHLQEEISHYHPLLQDLAIFLHPQEEYHLLLAEVFLHRLQDLTLLLKMIIYQPIYET